MAWRYQDYINLIFEFRSLFAEISVDDYSVWEEVQVQLLDKAAYMAVTEEQAVKMFKYVVTDLITSFNYLFRCQGLSEVFVRDLPAQPREEEE